MAILAYDSNFPSDLVPPALKQFIEKIGSYASRSRQSLDVFEPNPCSHGRWAVQILLSRAGVFLFLYFCPLEDDLDFDEEVEEERRR